jgi:hypothetical protein
LQFRGFSDKIRRTAMPLLTSPHHLSRRVGLSGWKRLAQLWDIPKGSWPAILHRSDRTIFDWYANLEKPVDLAADIAEILSHMFSIYNGLHRLYGDNDFADQWIRLQNPAFAGARPIDLLLTGRFEDLIRVRWYIDRLNAL